MEPKILLEDDAVLIIDKPAGMVVNAAQSVKGHTVQEWAEDRAKSSGAPRSVSPPSDFDQRGGVVHRLDKETSGVLVIAKTPEAFENLQKQFKARKVEKTYVALVHGKVEPAEGVISAPVGRLPWNRERFGVLAGGREAETKYKVLSVLSRQLSENGQPVVSLSVKPSDRKQANQNPKTENREQITEYSLLELTPKTGRTHQIRIHLKSIGHPIVADDFYAGRKTARADRKWCPRLFLHAKSISFTHPVSGERLKTSVELPEDLKITLSKLANVT